MQQKRRVSIILGISLMAAGWSVRAHHSAASQFDLSTSVEVTGTIQRVQWENPHVWFFVDVTEDDGTVTTWGFSTWPPGLLMRSGVTKDVLAIGATVNVEGARARDGSNNSSTRRLALLDGTELIPFLGAN